MKRVLLPCVLLVLGLAVLAWPNADVFAQAKPFASRTPPSKPGPTQNVYEVLAARKDLGKFVEMVNDADLKKLLSGGPDEMVTVFAPTDAAIGEVPRDVMKRIKANQASYVKYHIITNSLVMSSAIRGRKITAASASGEALQFDGTDKKNPLKVNDATLVETDIPATNGVIHIVSTALVPPSLKEAPAAPPVAPPAKPVAPVAPVAAAQPTMPSAASATATSGSTPMEPTTTSIPSAETTTGAIPEVTPESPAQQPVPPPAGDNSGSDKGFTLFGHKFGG